MGEVWRLFGAAATDTITAKKFTRPQTTSTALCTCSENLGQRGAAKVETPVTLVAPQRYPLAGRAAGTRAKTLRLYHDPSLSCSRPVTRTELAVAMTKHSFIFQLGPQA